MSIKMKRNLLFILICIFIFLSVIAQVSDQFITWLNPRQSLFGMKESSLR